MTTTPEIFQAQYPLALAALAEHAATLQLPAPWQIDFRGSDLIVLLHSGTSEAWTRTVAIDSTRNEERQPGGIETIRTEWDVRLPDTGFRLTLVAYRAQPICVPAVQAVSA